VVGQENADIADTLHLRDVAVEGGVRSPESYHRPVALKVICNYFLVVKVNCWSHALI